MTARLHGQAITWGLEMDDEGHREFKVSHLVQTDSGDGPLQVLSTPGLPAIGSVWQFGNDVDQWAVCTPKTSIKLWQHSEGYDGDHHWYRVDQVFSSKLERRSCRDLPVGDPLLEPPRVSGSFTKYTKEATHGCIYRYDSEAPNRGRPETRVINHLLSSSFEPISGAEAEFDESHPGLKISMNYMTLDLPFLCRMIDSVNIAPLWGLPARCIKLCDAPWERLIWGTCGYYYTVTYDFQINAQWDEDIEELVSGWDRVVADSGSKALNGHWYREGDADFGIQGWVLDKIETDGGRVAPDYLNPSHYRAYKDRSGENTRTFLDGEGVPAAGTNGPQFWVIEKYQAANFLLLGIPTTF